MTLELSLRIHETELRYQQNSLVDLTIVNRGGDPPRLYR
jgi:hypothetical protein